eukprot:scaffold73_cov131-Skeletonema_dohrnii-CCMP3373.AAC.6
MKWVSDAGYHELVMSHEESAKRLHSYFVRNVNICCNICNSREQQAVQQLFLVSRRIMSAMRTRQPIS